MVTVESIVNAQNLLSACQQVIRNGGAPGIDGMRTEELYSYLVKEWEVLQQAVLNGTYQPEAVRRVEIPKPNGGVRQLGIPTVIDRMLQQSIAQELDRHYDGEFSATSYGFRKGRSAHEAVEQATQYMNAGFTYIVEIDLEKFFDRVNHDRLMSRLSQRIEDKEVLRLIRRYLTCGVMEGGVKRASTEGTPQGGPLSPILSNIVLDELDKELEKRNLRFVRYADDISIFVGSERAAARILSGISHWIEERLKLRVNKEKSGIRRPSNGQLLGFGFWHGKGGGNTPTSKQEILRPPERQNQENNGKKLVDEYGRTNKKTDANHAWLDQLLYSC